MVIEMKTTVLQNAITDYGIELYKKVTYIFKVQYIVILEKTCDF